jgi:hypothetical protein
MHDAGTSVRRCMPLGSVILTAKPIAGHDALGEWRNPGQDDLGAADVLDLDSGPETGTSPQDYQAGRPSAGGHARYATAEPGAAV